MFKIPDILKSRTMQTEIIGFIVALILYAIPDLEPHRADLAEILLVCTQVLALRFAGEDIAVAFKTGERNDKYDQ
jgi:hypothetical protein